MVRPPYEMLSGVAIFTVLQPQQAHQQRLSASRVCLKGTGHVGSVRGCKKQSSLMA